MSRELTEKEWEELELCDSNCLCQGVNEAVALDEYTCECEHVTCLSPQGLDLDFENNAVEYYRYALRHLANGYRGVIFNPVEFVLEDSEEKE